MCQTIVLCVVVVFVSQLLSCGGLGLFHENTKIIFQPDELADYFGYSVLLNETGLFVGAPRARSRVNRSIAPGLVFFCPVEDLDRKNVTCKPFGTDVGNSRFMLRTDSLKDDMWYGAVIAAIPTGKLLICAPRWMTPYKDTHFLANGACYVQGQRRGQWLLPLQDMHRQAYVIDGKRKEYGEYGLHLNFYAYGQAGMSAKVTEGNTIIIGAPGLLQWTGGISEYMFYPDFNALSVHFGLRATTNPYNTKDVGPDDYLGYSVESGIFDSSGKTLYVAGAPRSSAGYGQVLIFEQSFRETDALSIKAQLRGPQLGSYFGASLVCTDLNGDGVVDLLVGAPSHAKGGGLPYDQGAVFVYLTERQNMTFVLKPAGHVAGSEESGARFGTTIAELGDVDGDGFTDIAIGAPWEKEGSGAVYIYRGSRTGLRSRYVQRIFAEGAKSFGISISKGVDIDSNNCNDLSVGAYQTGLAYVYRCVPTIQVFAAINVPDASNLSSNTTNFTALFCVNTPAKKMWPFVKIDLKAIITVDLQANRARLAGDSEYNISIKPGNDACEEKTIEIMPAADMTKPISIMFNLKATELMKENSSLFLMNAARLSDDSVLHSSFDIQLTDCGEDLICKPLLHMTLKPIVNPYIPGSGHKLGFQVAVLNKEESAYGAKVMFTLPLNPIRLPSDCGLDELNVTCNVPSPLKRGESVEWDFEMEYASKNVKKEELTISAKLRDPFYKEDNESMWFPNTFMLKIAVTPRSEFNISKVKALPNRTITVTREKFYKADSINFEHYYEITNLGPSDCPSCMTVGFGVEKNHPYEVNLSRPIEDCFVLSESGTIICERPLPANVSVPIVLPLRFNLAKHREILEEITSLNITSSIVIATDVNLYKGSVTTTLVFDPIEPIWPLIVGLIAGLALLAAIVYALYRYGFFSRTSRDELKKLQEQSLLLEDSSSTSADMPTTSVDAFTQDVGDESD